MNISPQFPPNLQNRVTLVGRMEAAAIQRRAEGLAPLTDEIQTRPRYPLGRVVAWGGAFAAAAGGLLLAAEVVHLAPLAALGAFGVTAVALGAAVATYALNGFRTGVEEQARQHERRRIARDLHDGLAQELAFISMQAHRLAVAQQDDRARDIAEAAARAVEESRQVIAELARSADEPFETQLEEVTRRLAARGGATLHADVDAGVSVNPEHRGDLLRIAGEAVNNGVRHGRATHIELGLREDDGVRLTVADNGVGFASDVSRRGFGLISMRERAEAIGGELRVRSEPGGGAHIEVSVR